VTHALIEAGVTYVAARHECNAVSMADAYAKASGELTVVSVHAGPGLTNSMTGIAEAAKSRTPLIVLAGDVPASDVTSTFFINQAELVRSVGAHPERIHSPASALGDTARAVQIATQERRTVVLSLPMDVQNASVPPNTVAPALPPRASRPFPDPDSVASLADQIARAKRPLILAGRGAVIADARHALLELGDHIGALLATSLQGNGLFAGQPWSLGVCGGFASKAAADILKETDLVLGFGASFTYWTTRHRTLFTGNTVVAQIDVENARLGSQRQVDFPIVGDATVTANELLGALKRRGVEKKVGWRTPEMRQRVAAADHHATVYDDVSTSEYLDPRTLTKAIDSILPQDRVLTLDAGHFMAWPPQLIRVPDARSSCMSVSFQSIGLGIASAIGTGLAHLGRLIVLGIGDGGYMMSIADLDTAVRVGVQLCILIYDDASYAAEVHPFSEQGYSVDFVKFPDLDLAGVARSMGARGVVARTLDDLTPLREWVEQGAPGVFVLDAKISPTLEADWHIHATRGGRH
jgi:thiamine pyrophosphate-dependent acetolactate synthase large subunit-like protein